MKSKILIFVLLGSLLANTSSAVFKEASTPMQDQISSGIDKISLHWKTMLFLGALGASVLVTVAGIVGATFAFMDSYGGAAKYPQTCGNNVTSCTYPTCATVGTCSLTFEGTLWCAECDGHGGGPVRPAPPGLYAGTSWGIPVAVISIFAVILGLAGTITTVSLRACGCCHVDVS